MAVQLSAEGLDHPTRARIYEHLLLQPGNHLRSIVRHMRIGFGTTLHHLNVLVQDGLIRTEKGNG
ncbi:MAG: winged helix-turn-helix transcriptional regulator, partial [Methanobacteriota archaeon]